MFIIKMIYFDNYLYFKDDLRDIIVFILNFFCK